MAIVGTAVMVAAVVHKRRYFRPPKELSLVKRILLISFVYFVPASVGWFFVAGVGLRAFAGAGYGIPSIVTSLCVLLGVYVLGSLILGAEVTEAGTLPRRW